MATNTTYYNLVKPTESEFADISVINGNMDLIDSKLKDIEDGKESLIKDAVNKTTLDDADTIPLSDSTALKGTKKITFANLKTLLKAIFATKDDISMVNSSLTGKEDLIKNASAKTTLVDADTIPLSDSAASSATKKISYANLKILLASWFLPLTGGTLTGAINILSHVDVYEDNYKAQVWMANKILYLRNMDNSGTGNLTDIRIPDPTTTAKTNLVSIGSQTYGTFKLYGEHNITVSTTVPSSALPEGAQHQVYA